MSSTYECVTNVLHMRTVVRIRNELLRMRTTIRKLLRMRTTVRINNTWQRQCATFAYNCTHM